MLGLRQRRLPFPDISETPGAADSTLGERSSLYQRYRTKLLPNPELRRALVSFQCNKSLPFYRWFKYKEGFSAELVRYVLDQFAQRNPGPPSVLDPFAGAGTTIFAAGEAGWQATGIELLPVGLAAIDARLTAGRVNISLFRRSLAKVKDLASRGSERAHYVFPHLRITQGAFPTATEKEMSAYCDFVEAIRDDNVKSLFRFALLSILEEISFTRKDGQYLRWDSRSKKGAASGFHKGPIAEFRPTIVRKLEIMLEDAERQKAREFSSRINVRRNTCLAELPALPDKSFDLVLTSPPYCNRYDYTRTYALELAYLGYGEEQVKSLRQSLLSATVENRPKTGQLAAIYQAAGRSDAYRRMAQGFEGQGAIQEVLGLLKQARQAGRLNNNNIPQMVEGYFFEMNLVVHELARVLRPGGRVVMVNDNVQYIGEEIPVDLIFADFAEHAGLNVNCIWVLPRGKGNSSQQMGAHGRNEIRKCVYLWSK